MSKTSWQELPWELVQMVTDHVAPSKPDLNRLQSTCKAWSGPTREAFYKKIEFDFDNKDKIKKLVQTLKETKDQHGKLVKYVEMLNFSKDEDESDLLEVINCLGEKCPYIISLHSDLYNVPEFWEQLIKCSGKWNFLKSITFRNHKSNTPSYHNKNYLDAIWSFRKTIQSIELQDSKDPIPENVQESTAQKLFYSLQETPLPFPSLKHLKINVCVNKDIFEYDPFIPCKLKSLRLNIQPLFYPALPEMDKRVVADLMLTRIEQCLDIRELDLFVALNSENAIRYIMFKFPTPDSLKINYNDNNNNDTDYDSTLLWKKGEFYLSDSTLSEFVDYLFRIDQYKLANIYMNNQMSFVKALIEKCNKNNRKTKHRLVVNCSAVVHNTIYDSNSGRNDNNNFYPIKISKTSDRLQPNSSKSNPSSDIIEYEINPIFLNIGEHRSFSSSKDTLSQMVGPHLSHVIIKPPNIDSIEDFEELDELIRIGLVIREGQFLSYIVSKCSNLKLLEIQDAEINLDDLQSVKTNESVEVLVLRNCHISLDVFSELSTCFPSLKHLELLGMNEIIDYPMRREGEELEIGIDMQHTALQSLTLSFERLEGCSLKLLIGDEGEQYYCNIISFEQPRSPFFFRRGHTDGKDTSMLLSEKTNGISINIKCNEFPKKSCYIGNKDGLKKLCQFEEHEE